MKKIYIYLFLAISCFFFFNDSIFAESVVISDLESYGSSPLGDNFTGSYFNYFSEKYNNTYFYRYISSGGFLNDIGADSYISVLSSDEYNYYLSINNLPLLTFDYSYVVAYLPSCPSVISYNSSLSYVFNINGPDIRLSFYDSSAYIVSEDTLSSYSGQDDNFILFLGSYQFRYDWYDSPWYAFWESDSYIGADYGVFLSKYFNYGGTCSTLTYNGPTINLFGAILNHSIIGDDFTQNNNLLYFKRFPLASNSLGIKPLNEILIYSNVSIPTNFTSVDISQNLGALFVPKIDISLTSNDYIIYTKSNSDSSYVRSHNTSDLNDFTNWVKSDDKIPQSYSYYNYYITYDKLTTGSNSYAIYYEPLNYNFPINFYYNSDAYDVYLFTNSRSYITYSNNSISYDDFYSNLYSYYSTWSESNTYGGSCEIFEYFDSESETCVSIGSGINNIDVGVINSDNSVSNVSDDFSITNFISDSFTGATTFIQAGLQIVALSTTFFNTLPSSVGSIILSMFSIGCVIIIWKIFRG